MFVMIVFYGCGLCGRLRVWCVDWCGGFAWVTVDCLYLAINSVVFI